MGGRWPPALSGKIKQSEGYRAEGEGDRSVLSQRMVRENSSEVMLEQRAGDVKE